MFCLSQILTSPVSPEPRVSLLKLYTRPDEPISGNERSTIPKRNDFCRIYISGVIGSDPKEFYLANGHYVISFSLGVVGHFLPIHEGEQYKPTETMWINIELWDNEAKEERDQLLKGTQFCGVGQIIHNKWIDKNTGEERKQFKIRILKCLALSDLLKYDYKDQTEEMPIE
eukprot:gene9726-20227_t